MGAQPETTMADALLKHLGVKATISSIGDGRKIGYIEGAILDARELVQGLQYGG